MPRARFATVDEYIAAQSEGTRRILERVSEAVRCASPGIEESIAYGIPTFKLGGRVVLHVAAWKRYVSIYPANARLVAAFSNELAPYLAEKSTLRFPLTEQIPKRLLERIVAFRVKEALES